MQKQRAYVAYLKDTTQDKQFRRLNPNTGTYLKRGETVQPFSDRDLPMLKVYFERLAAINKKLCFQIRDADTGTVVYPT